VRFKSAEAFGRTGPPVYGSMLKWNRTGAEAVLSKRSCLLLAKPMCGIIGFAAQGALSDDAWLCSGRDALHHRGPDHCGQWRSADGRVGFGHCRLAIVDLSPLAHQPMRDAAGDLCIVFNGEIYNFADLRRELTEKGYAFRSHSDTEVILAAYREWGTSCLDRLNGMFAFALYDGRERRLFMARDRAGEKPLFYTLHNGALRFASELKALFAGTTMRRRIDPVALDCYLAFGYVPGERCMIDGVKKLPPAHALLFDIDNNRWRLWRYWRLPEWRATHNGNDEAALLDELEGLLEDAVRRQMVADVPLGVLLSGGVDSSLVTAMAVRETRRVKTFTIRFPHHAEYDETEHARLIARHFATDHTELEASDCSVDLLACLARQFDEPIVDSSMIPTYLVSQLIRRHCTVALGGDGGDELFGGYPHYDRLLWMQGQKRFMPRFLSVAVAQVANRLLPVGFKGRNYLRSMAADLQHDLPLIACHFDRRTRKQLMVRDRWRLVAEEIHAERVPVAKDLLQRATRMDFENYLAEDILVKVDRASMMCSLEIRAPMLDYRIIEFAFGKVPSQLKATASSRKVLLKKLCSRLLPSEFDQRRKQGFSLPLNRWLRTGPWHDYFRDVLLESEGSPFDRRFVSGLLAGQKKGRSNGERLFALALFELWRKEYAVSLG